MQPLWKTVWRVLTETENRIPYYPAISLPGVSLRKTKTLIQKDIYTPMFIRALSTIAKI